MLLRRLYTTGNTKVPISLIAELRKQSQVSLSKAREALSHSSGSIPDALAWLEQDLISTGAQKAAKVSSRETNQGLIAQSVLSSTSSPSTSSASSPSPKAVGGVRAALIELNCETDFVARNQLFATLAADIAHTAAFLSDTNATTNIPLVQLADFPLIPHAEPNAHTPGTTIASAIRDTIVKVGENISLRRARSLVHSQPPSASTSSSSSNPNTSSILRLATYTHSPLHSLPCGPTSALVLLKISSPSLLSLWRSSSSPSFAQNLSALERSIARQIIAFPTLSIHPTPTPNSQNQSPTEEALLTQPFITLPGELNGKPVGEALAQWAITHGLSENGDGIEVLEFTKWSVGEPLPEEEEKV